MSDDWSGEVIDASKSVTDKPTDAVAQAVTALLATAKGDVKAEAVLASRAAALIAAVRAECAAKVRALPSVRYTDVHGNHIQTVVDRDVLLTALEAP